MADAGAKCRGQQVQQTRWRAARWSPSTNDIGKKGRRALGGGRDHAAFRSRRLFRGGHKRPTKRLGFGRDRRPIFFPSRGLRFRRAKLPAAVANAPALMKSPTFSDVHPRLSEPFSMWGRGRFDRFDVSPDQKIFRGEKFSRHPRPPSQAWTISVGVSAPQKNRHAIAFATS